MPLNDTYLDLASRFEVCVRRLVELMNSGATSSGDLRQEFADIADHLRAENRHVEAVERADDVSIEPPAPEDEIEVEAPPPEPVVNKISAPPAARVTKPVSAAPSRTPPPVALEPTETEQIDPELLEIFLEEAADIMASIEEALNRWRSQPGDRAQIAELKRSLHTLKGGARMAGAMAMGNLSHNTETLLTNVDVSKVSTNDEIFDLLDEAHDMLLVMLDSARDGKPVPDTNLLNAKLAALASGQPLSEVAVEAPESAPPEELIDEPAHEPAEITQDIEVAAPAMVAGTDEDEERRDLPETEEKQWPEKMERRGQVRVDTSLLNELVNYAGEVSLSRSRMEQQIYSFRDNLGELSRNIVRFRDQIRELEIQSESQILYRLEQDAVTDGRPEDFDPLEFDRFSRLQQVSRSLAESLPDHAFQHIAVELDLGVF